MNDIEIWTAMLLINGVQTVLIWWLGGRRTIKVIKKWLQSEDCAEAVEGLMTRIQKSKKAAEIAWSLISQMVDHFWTTLNASVGGETKKVNGEMVQAVGDQVGDALEVMDVIEELLPPKLKGLGKLFAKKQLLGNMKAAPTTAGTASGGSLPSHMR